MKGDSLISPIIIMSLVKRVWTEVTTDMLEVFCLRIGFMANNLTKSHCIKSSGSQFMVWGCEANQSKRYYMIIFYILLELWKTQPLFIKHTVLN